MGDKSRGNFPVNIALCQICGFKLPETGDCLLHLEDDGPEVAPEWKETFDDSLR